MFFAALPARPGVLMIEMREAGAQPYLTRTADIRRAAERLLREPEAASKRLNLRNVAAGVRYRVTGSKFEQTLALYTCARARFPKRYRDLLRLRPPAVLKVNLSNEYPRCYVTRRISGTAELISVRFLRGRARRRSRRDFSTFSKSGVARSKFGAIRNFRAVFIRR